MSDIRDLATPRLRAFIDEINAVVMRHRDHISIMGVVVEIETQTRTLVGNVYPDQAAQLLREAVAIAEHRFGGETTRGPRSS